MYNNQLQIVSWIAMRSKTEGSSEIWAENEKEEEKEEKSDRHKLRLTRRNTVWWEVARTLAPADHRRVSSDDLYKRVCVRTVTNLYPASLNTKSTFSKITRTHVFASQFILFFSPFNFSIFFLPSFLPFCLPSIFLLSCINIVNEYF